MVPTPNMIGAAGEHVVHPGDRADRHDEGRDRADERPRARIDEVVVVVLDVRRSHCGLSVSGAGRLRHIFVSNIKAEFRQMRKSSVEAAVKGCPCACPSSPAASGFGAGSRTG